MNKIRYRYIASASLLAALLLTACSDWENAVTPSDPQGDGTAIAFSGSVSTAPGGAATRANNSFIDIKETQLRADGDYSVGIFGCYTGQYKWEELVEKAKEEKDKDILNDYYTANLFFNQQAMISKNDDGVTMLTYSPQRFWPNNKLPEEKQKTDKTQHEYVTLWAYYPYNATSGMGDHGITMNVNKGEGMGSISFMMMPDAADQIDFMMTPPVMDCNKDKYPLVSKDVNSFEPKPVPLKFYHMLAQIRIYANITLTDYIVYEEDGEGNIVVDKDGNKIIDDKKSIYWKRGEDGSPELTYELSFNNIKTSTEFYPCYNENGTVTFKSSAATTMGTSTVKNYKMNSQWFKDINGKLILDDTYMFGEENFATGNIMLVVPQELSDDDVPHIILTAKGKDKENKELTAKLTINLLNMGIKWESGYVYCYAFTDELKPGDDKVQGPESITVVVDSNQFTDQW